MFIFVKSVYLFKSVYLLHLARYRLGLRQSQESFRLFRVSADTGHVVTVRDLTPFQAKTFNLIVEAVDGGSKPLAAQAEVKVTILDSVNNAPEIRMTLPPQKSKVSSVDEDARRGFVVGHFIVDDSDTGLNGEVRCYLDDSTRWGALAAETFGLQRLRESEYKVNDMYSCLSNRKVCCGVFF